MIGGTSSQSRPTTAKNSVHSPKITKKSPKMKTQQSQIDISQLCDLIEETIARQKECEAKGKYVQAQGFKRKAKELRQQLQDRIKHEKELKELEQAHLAQMNLFGLEWQKQIQQFNQQIDRLLNELRVKHQKQIAQLEGQIQNQRKFHESTRLLELRKMQQELAKQQNYMEAHRVQLKANKLEQQQMEKHQKASNSKSKNSLQLLKSRQQSEAQALKMRIQLQVEEKERDRLRQQAKLKQKYQNILKQTQFQQNQELINLNKKVKLNQLQKKSRVSAFSTYSREL